MNPDQMVQGMQGHMPSAVMQSQMQQQHVQQLHRFWYRSPIFAPHVPFPRFFPIITFFLFQFMPQRSDQMQEIEDMTQFKQSKMTLPLARIKKIMKFDEDVKVWPLQPPSILRGWACVVMCTLTLALCGHAHR